MILGVILVLLVGGALLWRYFTTYESTDDAQIDGHVNPISARVAGYVIKVNVDDNPHLAAQYGIRSIPTVLLFTEGQVVDQTVGVVPKQVLAEKLRTLVSAAA